VIKKILGKILSVTLAFIIALTLVVPAFGDTPFQGYNFNHWAVLVPAPAAYVPVRTFSANEIDESLGLLNDPTDIHVCPYGTILIVDSGNNRIIVFDEELNLLYTITGFYQDGVWQNLNRPHGVFVTENREVFIADTLSFRIVVLDWDGEFIREIVAPDAEGLEDDFIFRPLHVLVDRGGRTFVIVQHVFEGIMSFNSNGEFTGYFGTINVGFNPIELFWRFFMTDTQLERQSRFIPTEFQSMSLDEYNFVFTTNIEPWASSNQVMRLNPRGEDVIQNFNSNVAISGDQRFRPMGTMAGASAFIDIVARPNGMYTTLDSTRGRIYTYDSEGNLLYVFSGIGTIQGMTRRPVSIEMLGDNILVLDAGNNRVTQFAPTEYGRLINLAIELRYNGNDAAAADVWRELTRLDENFMLAWAGIGRSKLAEGDNVAAMYYLRRGMDLRYFSVAFRRNRLDQMQTVLPIVLTGGMGLIGAFVAYKIVKRIVKGKVEAV